MKPLLESIRYPLWNCQQACLFSGKYHAIHRPSFWDELLCTPDQWPGWLLVFRSVSAYLQGIRLTHQPSPWIGDYSWLLLTPVTGQLGGDSLFHRQSSYDMDKASFQPHYLKFSPCAIRLKPSSHRLATVLLFVWSKSKAKHSPSIFTQQMNWPWSK